MCRSLQKISQARRGGKIGFLPFPDPKVPFNHTNPPLSDLIPFLFFPLPWASHCFTAPHLSTIPITLYYINILIVAEQHPKYWMSLVWAGAIVTRAKKEGRIKDDFAFRTIIKEINKFRSGCGGLLDYDWISIPLVYTQA